VYKGNKRCFSIEKKIKYKPGNQPLVVYASVLPRLNLQAVLKHKLTASENSLHSKKKDNGQPLEQHHCTNVLVEPIQL
jgi:hypothetical protein